MRAFDTEKTEVAEVDRSIYDVKDAPNAAYEVSSGLTPEIVEKLSKNSGFVPAMDAPSCAKNTNG